MSAFGKPEAQFVDEVVKAYVTQKQIPQSEWQLRYLREKPLRDTLSEMIGMNVLSNPAQSKRALKDAGYRGRCACIAMAGIMQLKLTVHNAQVLIRRTFGRTAASRHWKSLVEGFKRVIPECLNV